MYEQNMRNVGYLSSVIGITLLILSYFLEEGTITQTAIICGSLFIVCSFITESIRYVYIAIEKLHNKD